MPGQVAYGTSVVLLGAWNNAQRGTGGLPSSVKAGKSPCSQCWCDVKSNPKKKYKSITGLYLLDLDVSSLFP